jgi:phenylalanyl-tRNA synthetase beta chain
MANPLSEEAANLRPSLLPGMLTMLAGNLNRDVATARLFELGEVFAAPGRTSDHIADVVETRALTLGLTSASLSATPLHSAADAPVFELKGAIESVASLFNLPGGPEALSFTTAGVPGWLEPGRSATAILNGVHLAHFGELARSEQVRRKLRQPVIVADLHVPTLLDLPLRKVTAHELSRFQAVERDFSFLFPDTLEWHTISAAIHALALPDLRSLAPLEIFRDPKGKSIAAGQHSLLLRTVFQSPDRTLREEELSAASNAIIATLTALDGVHRA